MNFYLNYNQEHEVKKQKQEENRCDICGAPDAIIRTFEHPEYGIIDWLSGFTCQKCLDADKEHEHVNKMWEIKNAEDREYNTLAEELEKLYNRTNGNPDAEDVERITIRLDELDKNQEVRDQLAKRFQRVRLGDKAYFICTHGQGVKHEKCEVCGQGNSFLCIVEDQFESHVEMLDEIAGWFCLDCITTGIQDTHTGKALRELLIFRNDCENVKEKYQFFMSRGKSQLTKREMKECLSIFKHGKELEKQEALYKRKAESMKKTRLEYMDIPLKTVIKTAGAGDPCFLCGKTCGKDHKCGDMQDAGGV
jgi:ribosomal protein S14